MKFYTAGKIVRRLREQRGISQTRLAEGIMDRTNLTRLESGKQGMSIQKLTFLFERLGYSMRKYFPYMLSLDEQEFYEIRDKIKSTLHRNEVNDVEILLNKLEENPNYREELHKQFIAQTKATLCLITDNNLKQAQMYLDEAISYTVPDYHENNIETFLLASDDIEIITMMADVSYREGDYDKAILILKNLAHNIRKNLMDAREKAISLTFVLYNLSIFLGLQNRHNEVLSICNEAIEAGQINEVYGLLPMLLYNKAFALYCLNEHQEIKNLLYQTYYGFLMIGQIDNAAGIKKKIMENFQIDLDENP
jgi:transcriptional regulator with XRE-family HTH domain